MAVGRISGPLLKDNLLRNGVNLAFETSLLYLDVKNGRVGINNATPLYQLDVIGTTQTTNIEAANSSGSGMFISMDKAPGRTFGGDLACSH